MTVVYPWALLGIPLVLLFWRWRRRRPMFVPVTYSDAGTLKGLQSKWTTRLHRFASNVRLLVLLLLVLAIAQPQFVRDVERVRTQGIDILLLMDVSYSMNAEDLAPNRMEVAKKTIEKFIKQRQHDRIGLIVFGGKSFTRAPLTIDHAIVRQFLRGVTVGDGGEGTGIGLAIATGLNRMQKSPAKSKTLILLTDGENNAGDIDPMTAAQLAKQLGVKIHVVGVGKEGGAPIPYFHATLGKQFQRDPRTGRRLLTKLDEPALKAIANEAGGLYFRAKDSEGLEDIYNRINLMEVSDLDAQLYRRKTDVFPFLMSLILLLLLLEGAIIYSGRVTVP